MTHHRRLWIPFRDLTWTCLLAAGFFAGMLGVPPCSHQTHSWKASSPKLSVSPSSLDLGEGAPGQVLAGSVLLNNEGEAVLHVKEVATGCACLSFHLSQREIAPGGEASLTFTAAIRTAGEHLQFPVRILSDDPDGPETVLGVRLRGAPPPFSLIPACVDFTEVSFGTSPVQRLSLKAADGKSRPAPGAIVASSAQGAVRAEVEVSKGEAPAEAAVIAVRPRADLPSGGFADMLAVRVSGLDYIAHVPRHGIVVPPLAVSPKAVLFGNVVRGSALPLRCVEVRRTGGKALADMAKTSAPPGVYVEEADPPATSRGKASRRLRIGLEPEALKNDLEDADIRLWFAGEPRPLTVKVSAFLSRPGDSAGR
jgi:hypothetical protein